MSCVKAAQSRFRRPVAASNAIDFLHRTRRAGLFAANWRDALAQIRRSQA